MASPTPARATSLRLSDTTRADLNRFRLEMGVKVGRDVSQDEAISLALKLAELALETASTKRQTAAIDAALSE